MTSVVYRLRSRAALPLLVALLILFSTFSAELSEILRQRLLFCLEHLIPSLFAGMFICNFAQCCGALKRTQRFLCRKGWNGPLIIAYLLSQVAGYPAGMILLKDQLAEGRISQTQAAGYACACFGAGPSFIVGLVGAQLLGSALAGWLIFFCCGLANLLTAFVLLKGEWRFSAPERYDAADDGTSALVTAVQLTMDALWRILGMILLFGVLRFTAEKIGLLSLLKTAGAWLGISPYLTAAFCGTVLDVTAIPELCSAGVAYHQLLPVLAALLSFGGMCVHCQNRALGGAWLPFRRLFVMRAATGILAALICIIMLPLFPPQAVTDAFATQMALSKSGSLLPSFLIFCTGFPLFLKKDWTK